MTHFLALHTAPIQRARDAFHTVTARPVILPATGQADVRCPTCTRRLPPPSHRARQPGPERRRSESRQSLAATETCWHCSNRRSSKVSAVTSDRDVERPKHQRKCSYEDERYVQERRRLEQRPALRRRQHFEQEVVEVASDHAKNVHHRVAAHEHRESDQRPRQVEPFELEACVPCCVASPQTRASVSLSLTHPCWSLAIARNAPQIATGFVGLRRLHT